MTLPTPPPQRLRAESGMRLPNRGSYGVSPLPIPDREPPTTQRAGWPRSPRTRSRANTINPAGSPRRYCRQISNAPGSPTLHLFGIQRTWWRPDSSSQAIDQATHRPSGDYHSTWGRLIVSSAGPTRPSPVTNGRQLDPHHVPTQTARILQQQRGACQRRSPSGKRLARPDFPPP